MALASVLPLIMASAAAGEPEPRIGIQTKLLFVDPGTQEANFSVKVKIEDCPESAYVRFAVRGYDDENFILAELPMHGSQCVKGQTAICTKRFELPDADYRRIRAWQIANAGILNVAGCWELQSLKLKSIPDEDGKESYATIGTILIRAHARYRGESPPDCMAIQGLDSDGFEVCHVLVDEAGCRRQDGSRRGRWDVVGGDLECDAFQRVFRPLDFETIPRLSTWRTIPLEIDRFDRLPWTGDKP